MIHMKSSTKKLIETLEDLFNDIQRDEILQSLVREELGCILLKFPLKRSEDEQPTWADCVMEVYRGSAFEDKFVERKSLPRPEA